jgi:hypothetical protein
MSEAQQSERQHTPASDFLSRLIDGAFERTSSLEPRLPSLFEPQATAFGTVPNWPEEAASRSAEHASPVDAEDRPTEHINRQNAPTAVSTPIMSDRLSTSTSEKAPEQNVLALKHLSSMAKGNRLESPAGQEHEPQHLLHDLPPGGLLAKKPIPIQKTIYKSFTYVNMLRKGESSLQPIEGYEHTQEGAISPEQQMRKIVIEPLTVRRRPERQPLYADAATPSPEPVVNVTIGRVEVRAVQAPLTTSRQRTEPHGAKPMSLADYLKQRGGGR